MVLDFKTTADLKISDKIIGQVIGQSEAVEVVKKAAQQRRHVLLIGEPGTGKCVGKDSAIQLSDGRVMTAEELYFSVAQNTQILALAVNPDLSLSHSSIIHAKKTLAPALAFRTNSGKTITVSHEHPFLTINERGVSWKHARELSTHSFIATARRIETTALLQELPSLPLHYAPTIYHTNVKRIKLPLLFNEDFAEFCGYLWSEGYIARKRSITFTNSEENLIKRFANHAKQLFGLETHIRYFSHKHAFVATIQSVTLGHVLEQLGWSKKIPDILLKSPNHIIASFLRAYFDGDGSVTKRGFEVTTKNHFAALQIQSLLLRFGIITVLRKRLMRATNSRMQPKLYSTLQISDSSNLTKLATIGFSIPRKIERLISFQGKKAQSNIDRIPHIGSIIFELKEKLRLTSEDIGIEIHQFKRYLHGTRIPTHATVQKVSAVFAQRFVALQRIQPKIFNDGTIDLAQLSIELGISKTMLAHKTSIPYKDIDDAFAAQDSRVVNCIQSLIAECISTEVEKQVIALHQLSASDVIWERVTRIDDVGIQELYDFEAEKTHNFLANNIFVHNSMLGLALAELLPKEKLVDIIAFSNPHDENQPVIRTAPAGKGRELVSKAKLKTMDVFKYQNWILLLLVVLSMFAPWWARSYYNSDIIFAAFFIGGMVFVAAFMFFISFNKRMGGLKFEVPKVIVDNFGKKIVPFWDATGAHAGALLGDVLHDPLQSGGLGTPAHERIVAGMIHKANMGVLFVDEIATLDPSTQQELLTALQEGKYSITGQSERSSGAMVRTEPVPCNFILVAAGNVETIQKLHPALRSRIRGYGYEVFMNETISDTLENQERIAHFVAQEVVKDKKIPHFSNAAVQVIINEARKMANRKSHLTLRLRELGGLIRAAGDVACEENSKVVEPVHILKAKKIARTLEQQIADKFIERKKEYDVIVTEGVVVGRVNGLAVIGGGAAYSGIILPIEAEVASGGKEKDIVATGKLGTIAKEAVKNVSAIIKKHFGANLKDYDIHVQFLQTYEGVEGDSASIAVATAIISALEKVPVKQSIAMTGSLSVRGEVLPIGGVSAKVEAAIDLGLKAVIVPHSNMKDIIVDKKKLEKIQVIPVRNIKEVLKNAFEWKGRQALLKKIIKK